MEVGDGGGGNIKGARGRGTDLSGLGYGHVLRCCEHGTETLDPTKCTEFLD